MSTFQSIHIHLKKTVWALIYCDEKEAYLFLSTPPFLLLPHQALTVCQHKATGKDLQPRNTLSPHRAEARKGTRQNPQKEKTCASGSFLSSARPCLNPSFVYLKPLVPQLFTDPMSNLTVDVPTEQFLLLLGLRPLLLLPQGRKGLMPLLVMVGIQKSYDDG